MDKLKTSDEQDEIAIRLWDEDKTILEDILVKYVPSIEKALGRKYRSFSIEDLEDIVCEAIKRLWEKRKEYSDSQGSVKALLYRIADNIAKDLLKFGWKKLQEKREYWANESLEDLATIYPSQDKDEDSKDCDSPLNVDLREIVNNLPVVQQKIIWAFALAPEGEINATIIGKDLGYPATTIRVYLKRAKETIRDEMKKRGHNI